MMFFSKKEFVISRKDICSSLLMYRENVLRGMTISINHNNISNDLIYNNTRQYRVNELSAKVPVGKDYAINFVGRLNELLISENYGEMLTQKELIKVHEKHTVNKAWLEEFKWQLSERGVWVAGGAEKIPHEIYVQLLGLTDKEFGVPHQLEPGSSSIKIKR